MQLEDIAQQATQKRVECNTSRRPHNLHKCRRGQRPPASLRGAAALLRGTPSRLPGLFDAVQPLDNARSSRWRRCRGHGHWHCHVPKVTVTVLRLFAVRTDHAGAAEVERDDVRVGPREFLHARFSSSSGSSPVVEALPSRPRKCLSLRSESLGCCSRVPAHPAGRLGRLGLPGDFTAAGVTTLGLGAAWAELLQGGDGLQGPGPGPAADVQELLLADVGGGGCIAGGRGSGGRRPVPSRPPGELPRPRRGPRSARRTSAGAARPRPAGRRPVPRCACGLSPCSGLRSC